MEEKIISEALASYGLSDANWTLIRHNENITCRVQGKTQDYVLRIRKPTEGFHLDIFGEALTPYEMMQSEMALLVHLKQRGLPVQGVEENKKGQMVTLLSDQSPACLLSWIEGSVVTQTQANENAQELGLMAAQLHKAAEGFTGKRLHYEEGLLFSMQKEMENALIQGDIDKETILIYQDTLTLIRETITENKKRHGLSLIHADLGLSNILSTKNGFVPIDFSLSGTGCFEQECGQLASNFSDDALRNALRKGFLQGGAPVSKRQMNIFLSLGVLLFICTQHTRFAKEAWFKAALQRWKNTLFSPLLN